MQKAIIKSCLIFLTIALTVSPTFAAKPQGVIEKSNGFPSGLHFNLNVHGRSSDYMCNDTPGGNSVSVCESGEQLMQYVSNKKSSLTELFVLDPCSDCFPPDYDPVTVMLPHNIETDTGEVIPADGFWVIGRILGKPNNGKCAKAGQNGECPSNIIWYSNKVTQACMDDGSEDFADYTSCDEVMLGVIVGENIYLPTDEVGVYERFKSSDTESSTKGGKGHSKGTDMTPLFTFVGWVSWGACPETDGIDGITDDDIPLEPDPSIDLDGSSTVNLTEWILYHPDTNCDGEIDQDDVDFFIANGPTYGLLLDMDESGEVTVEDWYRYQETLGHSTYYDDNPLNPTWIFNIADLVLTEQVFDNDGTKLFQIRFYPRATTTFR
jgi:hypothetical protein